MSEAQISSPAPLFRRARSVAVRWPSARECAGVVVLAGAYFGAAKLGQTLRYTASVSAIWPPVGLGMAALYVFGLRLWPGIFLGELIVNGQLLFDHPSFPVGSLIGQQAGNMAEVIVGAWLLRRLIGPRAALDRTGQIFGMIVATGAATAISATVGTVSMLAGGVIDASEVPTFWRTWLLGDTAGAVVVLPLALTWLRDPAGAWRRIRTVEGALMIASVGLLTVVVINNDAPLTYLVFPSLIWAAFRFGPPGVTLATAITAGLTIGITADQLGVFFKQPIDNRTLSTQLYILVVALTPLFLSALVSERERSATELVESRRRESEAALEERRRIARDLHDSVSQALFSSALHTRAAQKALEGDGSVLSERVGPKLSVVGELTKQAQTEMRRFIFEWAPGEIGNGLVPTFARHVSTFPDDVDLHVAVDGPVGPLPIGRTVENQLFGIGREALANVVRHAGARTAHVRVEADASRVVVEIEDDGCGFDPAAMPPGHYGLESMRSRAEEIGADLEISSTAGVGTVVRVGVPVDGGLTNGA